MKINDIITKYYEELKAKCHNDDRVISMGRTSQDVLQDVCLTAIRKYKNKEVSEEDGKAYLYKTLFYELKFQTNRIDPKMVYTEDLTPYDRQEPDPEM